MFKFPIWTKFHIWIRMNIFELRIFHRFIEKLTQESIPVRCVPPSWEPYVLQFQWPPSVVSPGGAQMNKFEQVSSDHQEGDTLPDLSQGGPYLAFPGGGILPLSPPPPCEQTGACENITFPQTYLRAVMRFKPLTSGPKVECVIHWATG